MPVEKDKYECPMIIFDQHSQLSKEVQDKILNWLDHMPNYDHALLCLLIEDEQQAYAERSHESSTLKRRLRTFGGGVSMFGANVRRSARRIPIR